jgi:type I restriction enzyme S subunit
MANSLRQFANYFTAPTRNGLTRPKAVRGSGVKMVNMGELFANGRIYAIPMDRVPLSASEADRFLLQPGDLLFARQSLVLSGAGKCTIFLGDSEPVTFESHIIRVRIDSDRSAPLFFYYYFQSPHGRAAIDSIVEQGAGVAGIRGSDLATMRVADISHRDQRVIASVLGTLDDKIELNRRMNETLEGIARALFKSWFVDFDPVRAKAEGRTPFGMDAATAMLIPSSFEVTEHGRIPKGWKCAPLGDWVVAFSGGTPSSQAAHYWGGTIPWISPKAMTAIHADDAGAYVTADAVGNGTRMVASGATLVMVRGMGLHEGVRVSQARSVVTFNQDVKALVGKTIEENLLFFALLDGQQKLFESVESSGHGTGTLPSGALLSLRLTMPVESTQRKLAEPLKAINDRIALGRNESRTLSALRDTLLPKLLSGEIRVRDAERIAESAV